MRRKKEMTIREMARLGGLKGGPARAAAMTAEERQESARKAGQVEGTARAQRLSPKRRREIAKKAAEARWAK